MTPESPSAAPLNVETEDGPLGSISQGATVSRLEEARRSDLRRKAPWLHGDFEIALSATMADPLPPLKRGRPVDLTAIAEPKRREERQELLKKLGFVSLTAWPDFAFAMIGKVDLFGHEAVNLPPKFFRLDIADGGSVWCDTKKGTFSASRKNPQASIGLMVAAARAKGWTVIQIDRGDAHFREEVWLEAQRQGVTLAGYQPSPQLVEKFARESQRARLDEIRAAISLTSDPASRERCARAVAPWTPARPEDRQVCAKRMEILRHADPDLAEAVDRTVTTLGPTMPGSATVAQRLESLRGSAARQPEDEPAPMAPGGP